MNDGRWWEFYGIRYAMGTVIGALVVYLLFSQNSTLRPLLLLPQDPKDFGGAHLALLAAYGVTYCYLASAPVLILHTCRCLFWTENNGNGILNSLKRNWSVIILPIAGGVIGWFLSSDTVTSTWKSVAAAIFVAILTIQVVLLVRVAF